MGFIPIDSSLNISEEIADFFNALIVSSQVTFPVVTLPQIIAAKARSGLDSDATTATILSRFPECPIPNGPLSDGSPNSLEILVKIIIEEVFNSIQNNMRVDIELDPGLIIESTGANGGGPVISVGSSSDFWTGTGVAS